VRCPLARARFGTRPIRFGLTPIHALFCDTFDHGEGVKVLAHRLCAAPRLCREPPPRRTPGEVARRRVRRVISTGGVAAAAPVSSSLHNDVIWRSKVVHATSHAAYGLGTATSSNAPEAGDRVPQALVQGDGRRSRSSSGPIAPCSHPAESPRGGRSHGAFFTPAAALSPFCSASVPRFLSLSKARVLGLEAHGSAPFSA